MGCTPIWKLAGSISERTFSMASFNGKIVIITGAESGIRRALICTAVTVKGALSDIDEVDLVATARFTKQAEVTQNAHRPTGRC